MIESLPFLVLKQGGRIDDDGDDQICTLTTQVCGLYSVTHHNRCSLIEGVVLAILDPESKGKRVQRSMNNQEHNVAVERGEEAV